MFNRQNVKEFRSDFQKAVEKLEEQYGCNISLGTISFDGSELRGKMTARKGERLVKATKDDFQIDLEEAKEIIEEVGKNYA